MAEIEIICVNDGSTDNSKRVLRKFARNDRRIKVIHKKNGGLSSARNAGLDYFRGEVVMFLDSDDYLAPNACERVWTEMQKQPTDILIFGTQIFPAIPKAPDWYSRTLNVTDHRYTKPGAEVLFTEHCSKPFVWRQAFSGRILKKKCAFLSGNNVWGRYCFCTVHSPLQDRLNALEKLHSDYDVHTLCEALNVARGTYYNHILRNKRDNVWFRKREEEYRILIHDIFYEFDQIFGAKKIHAILQQRGHRIKKEYVARIMRDLGLSSIRNQAKNTYEFLNKKPKNIVRQQFNV